MSCQCIEWFAFNEGLFTSRFVSQESIHRKRRRGEKGVKLIIFLGSSLSPASVSDFLGCVIRGLCKRKGHL